MFFLVMLAGSAAAQVSGTVYRDFNANGTRDNTNEIGVAGVTVTITGATSSTSVVTNSAGAYTVTPTFAAPYRVQFTNLPTGYFAGQRGSQSGTTVQFALTSPATINLGVNYPADYCQTEPNFLVPCYVNGDGTNATGTAAAQPVLVTLPYSATSSGGNNAPSEVAIAQNSQIGTVYGIAYQRVAKYTFSSAFVKRHSGLGSSGAGAIYITKPSGTTYVSSLFATIPNVGTVATNAVRGLPASTTAVNQDPTVFDQVGKAGLGDMEISEDGNELFVVNLGNRQLYRVPIVNPTAATPTAGTPVGYTIPTPTQVTGSVFRPFGLKYYRGRVYVGGVTTNEGTLITKTYSNTANTSSAVLPSNDGMVAVVYEFNPADNTFAQVLSFPLTYRKGAANADKVGLDRADFWFPWTATQRFVRNDDRSSYPQPMLAGIEFDVDGSMILSLRDRFGDQFGNNNLGPIVGDTKLYSAIAPGDILRAGKCNPAVNTWTIENNASVCGGTPTLGANNGQGIGGGEYYYGDQVAAGGNHAEQSQGGLALLPGKGEIATIAMDPTDIFNTGGIERLSNTTGNGTGGVQIYSDVNVALYGKANGLGDLELTCDVPPIEIGNRIWNDGTAQTSDGLQGSSATSLSAVTVQLYRNGTLVATATTNAIGEYYFNNTNVPGGLLPNTAYEIRVPLSQTALAGAGYVLALSNAGTNDEIDNDGVLSGGNAVIALTTGDYGENNHSYDMGFTTCPTISSPSPSQTVCSGTSVSSLSVATNATGTGAIRFVYFTSPQSGTAAYAGGTNLANATPANGVASLTSVAFPANTGTTPVVYYVYAVFNPTPSSQDCRPLQQMLVTVNPIPDGTATGGTVTCIASATVAGSSTVAGSTFRWTGPNSFTSNAQSFTTTTAGTYSLVVTANGCTDPTAATAVVTLNTTPPQNVSATNDGPLTCADPVVNVSATTTTTGSTYRWAGPGGFTSTAQNFNVSVAGTYSVTVTGPNGCTATATTTINQDTTPPANVTATNTGPLTCTLTTVTVSASSSTAGVTYRWSSGQTTASFTTSTAGTYSVTVTAPNGCTAVATTTVTQNTAPPANVAATNTGPLTCTLTTATVSASSTTAGVTYRWAGPGGFTATTQNFNTSVAGTYSVTVTGPNGCTATATTTLQQDIVPPTVTATNTGPLTCTLTSATVSATANEAVAYRWVGPSGFTASTQSFTTSVSGTYSVTVTNARGCTAVTTTTVQQDRTTPTVTATNTGPLTCTLTAVNVSASANEAVTYRWSSGQTTASFSVSATGTYSVTVTAANGCTATTSTTVQENRQPPVISATNTGPLTCTLTSVTVSATANEPVAYRWAGPSGFASTASSFTTSVAGTYSVTATSANGCVAITTTTVGQNVTPPANVTATNNGPLSCTLTTVNVSASSSTAGVTYRWAGPNGFTSTAQNFNISVAGTYSVTLTSPNGCTATASTTVGQDITAPAGVAATNNGPLTCAQTTATVSASSTTAGVTYRWAGPNAFTSTAQSFTTNVAGTYSVTVTSPNGCTTAASTTVNQNITPPANVTATNNGPLSCTFTAVTVSASSSTAGVTYRWAGPGAFTSTAQSFTTNVAGTYSVTVTNPANGCTAVTTTTVGQDVTPPAGVAATNNGPLTCAQTTATVSASSTTAGVTYRWSGPSGFTSTAQNFTTSIAGTYSVTVTSPNGCTTAASTTINQNIAPPADVTAANTGPLTCTLTTVTVSASSSTPGVTYRWTGPGGFTATTQSFATNVAGTYSVTVTAPNGCTTAASTSVGQNNIPPAGVAATNNGPLTCAQTTATVSASSTTAGVTYRWAGPSGFTSTSQSFTTSIAGTYSVTVTNPANGCATTTTTTIGQDLTAPAGVVASNTGPLTCTLTSATVSVASTTSGLTYRWAGPSGFTSTAQSFTTSIAGTYSVTVTGANGCTATASTRVQQDLTAPTVAAMNTGPLTCTLTSATVSAMANEPVAYRWIGPNGFTSTAQSFSTSIAGTYSVTVTNANGCTAVATTTVQQDLTAPTKTATNTGPLTCTLTSVAVSVTTNEPVTYRWVGPSGFTSTTQSFTTSIAGTYSVTVTNANGCTANTSTTVQQDLSAPTVSATNGGPLTCTTTNVTVSATANEPVTYRWAGPNGFTSTAQSFTTSIAGAYSVTVTNGNGCTAVTTTNVQQNIDPPANVVATNDGPLNCAKGTAEVSVTSSTLSTTYRWAGPGGFTSTAQSFNTSIAGTYSVTATNPANGCTTVTSTNVIQNNTPLTGVTATNDGPLSCTNTVATVSANSTTPGVTYSWTGPGGFTSTAKSFTTSIAGTYSVTVSGPNGCVPATVSTTVTQDITTPANVTATNNGPLSCTLGSVTVSASSSTPGVTYNWSGPGGFVSDEQSFITASAGVFSVTVTSPNGCTATATTTVGQDNTGVQNITISNTGPLNCTLTAVTVSASTSTPNVTYRWSGPGGFTSTQNSFTTSIAGAYSLTLTGPNGCTAVAETTVEQNVVPPTVLPTNTGPLTCTMTTATVSVTTSAQNPIFRWVGPNGFTSTARSFTTSIAGTYSVTITRGSGCTATASTTVAQDITPPAGVTATNNSPLSCTLTSVTVSASSSTPGVLYRWSGPGGFATDDQSFATSVSGTYSVTVINTANGCTTVTSTSVGQDITPPAGVTATNNGPLSCTLTSVTVSANSTTPGVTYRWVGPGNFTSTAQSFSTSLAGTYSVTITAPNGCSATTSTVVNQDLSAPTVTATNTGPLTCTLTSATVSATANEPVTYRWSNGQTTASFSTSIAGTYSVTVTNANGCTATTSTTIQIDQTTPTVAAMNTGPLTCTLTSATVSAMANEAVTYRWVGPNGFTSTAQSFSTSIAGTYSVTVTAPNGCTATTTTTLQQDIVAPNVVASNTGPLTCTLTSVNVTATPDEPVSYLWNTGATTATISVSAAGPYSVTVTAPNGCTATATTNVISNTVVPTVTATVSNTLTIRQPTATISTEATAGVTYRWSTGETTPTISVSATGTYSVTVTSPNGCTAATTTNVFSDTAAPTVTASVSNTLTCAERSATISTTATQGVTYLWNTGATTSSILVSVEGPYSVTVTAPNGATAATTTTVFSNTVAPTVTASVSNTLTCAQTTATISTTASAGVTYLWNTAATTASISVSAAGPYSVTVTSANGCTATTTTNVVSDTATPTVTASVSNTLTCAQPIATISTTATQGVTYRWSTGATTASIAVSAAGPYSVTVTSANGCTATTTTNVVSDTATPTVTALANNTLTCAQTTATISTTATPGVTYRWNTGATTPSITVSAAGPYSVTVTSANGCTATTTTNVVSDTATPTVTASANNTLTCAQTTATISTTASAGVIYRWSTGATTSSITVSAAGPYSVTVTSANGCTATTTTNVEQNIAPPTGVVATNNGPLTCAQPTAVVSVTANEPVTYRWSTGQTTASFSVSATGTYSVTVTGVNGCTATASTTVTQDVVVPTVTAMNTGPLTCTLTSATVSAMSNETVTYRWSSGQTTASFSTSLAGTYSVTVTAANGCTATASTTVQQDLSAPTKTATNTGPLTCTLTSVNVSVTTDEPVVYNWSGPNGFASTAQSFSTSLAGTYSVTVTNANGCTATTTTTVQQDIVAPNVVASNTGPLTCTLTSVNVTATPDEPVSYLWNTGATTATISVSAAGPYSVTVTSANGCTATTTTNVASNTAVPTIAANGGVIACQGTTIQLAGSATPSTVVYSWTGPNNFTSAEQNPTVSAIGTYTVTVTNTINGCAATDTAIVTKQQCASLGDFVFEDVNANGQQDANEPGIANVSVRLLDANNVQLNATNTDANGVYSFTGLTPGLAYVLEFSNPTGYTATVANQGSDATDSDADPLTGRTGSYTLAAGGNNPTIDAGFYRSASLGDKVFADTDRDGLQDGGEPGIANVTVRLLDNNGTQLATTTTDANGIYGFTGLTPGIAYVVEFGRPTNYSASTANQGGNDAADSDADPLTGRTGSYTLASGENNTTVDAGFYLLNYDLALRKIVANQPSTLLPGSNVTFNIEVFNQGELPASGIVVTDYVPDGFVFAQASNPGWSTEPNPTFPVSGTLTPGSSTTISIVLQVAATAGGQTLTNAAEISSDNGDDVDSTPDAIADNDGAATDDAINNQNGDQDDSDIATVSPSAFASLGDLVFEDINANGLQDAGEPGIANIPVRLLDANANQLATTTTNAGGVYSFTGLTPGVAYVVEFGRPTGYTATFADVVNDADDFDSDADPVTGRTGSYTLASGENNTTVDAGFYRPAALGNRVFVDANRNGVQDQGEVGLAGVTVNLLDNGGVLEATTTTDANGVYSFTGLTPRADYQVQFITPATYTATLTKQGGDNALDSDPINGITEPISLTSGETNNTVDAGFYLQPSALGNYVYEDVNANGQQDAGEPPISGVTVSLLQNNAIVATTTTNAAGVYSFTALTPGVPYSVSFTAPAGYTATVANQGDDATDSDANVVTGLTGSYTLAANETNNTVDAGFYRPAALGDRVFVDANRNGQQDAGEVGLANVTVSLVSNGAAVATTTTDAAGAYSFTGLTPGVPYSVSFTTPTNYTASAANQESDDTDSDAINGITAPVSLTSGETNNTIDAGFYLLRFDLTLSKTIASAPTPLLPGSVITYQIVLTNQGELTATNTVVTDYLPAGTVFNPAASPGWSLSGANAVATVETLAPGASTTLILGVTLTDASGGVISNRAEITVDSGDDVDSAPNDSNVNQNQDDTGITNLQPDAFASLGNFVFEDVNANGLQDERDLPIANLTVTLYQNNTVVNTTTTDINGVYSFTGLTPGVAYQVQFTAPTGYTATVANVAGNDAADSDADPVTGRTGSYILASGENNPTIDAGFYRPAALGNRVFVDANRNGLQDAGEVGLANVTVSLVTNGAVVTTTTTDANGIYSFTGLTPRTDYQLQFTTPATYTATLPNQGANNTLDSDPVNGITAPVSLTSGETNNNRDAGFYLIPAALGNYVYEDVNANGQQDAGEPPISGVTVSLVQNNTVVATTTTDANGIYSFVGLVPGVPYSVSFTAPVGYTATVANQGDDATDSDANAVTGLTQSYTLAPGETNNTVDAGYYRPASLGDRVFADVNRNGQQDEGENGIPNVIVTLFDGNGVRADTTTNTSGIYSFTGLTPGVVYTVQFTNLASYSATIANTGNDATDSDADPLTGRTGSYTLASGENNTTVDAGYYCIPPTITATAPPVCAGNTLVLTGTSSATVVNYDWVGPNGFAAGQDVVSIPNATTANTGSYTLTVTDLITGCSSTTVVDVVVNPTPEFTLTAREATCNGGNSLTDGQVIISNFGPNDRYDIVTSATYNGATSYATAKPIPANGIITEGISRTGTPQTYIVRVYSATECFGQKVVTVQNTPCECPPPSCAPVVLKKIRIASGN